MKLPAKKWLSLFSLVAILVIGTTVYFYTRQCTLKPLSQGQVRAGLKAASALEKWLNETGADVVIVARQGQSLKEYGITYSHAAFAVKTPETQRWTLYHQLNECPKDTSVLRNEDLSMFFMNAPKSYQAAAVVPNIEIQQKIKAILKQPHLLAQMYDNRYSAVACPFSLERQNSNSWILEIFAQAVSEGKLTGRAEAQNWLKEKQYQPSLLEVGLIKAFSASLFVPNVSLKGHPDEDVWEGKLWVNSGDSTLNFFSQFSMPSDNCKKSDLNQGVCVIETVDAGEVTN